MAWHFLSTFQSLIVFVSYINIQGGLTAFSGKNGECKSTPSSPEMEVEISHHLKKLFIEVNFM